MKLEKLQTRDVFRIAGGVRIHHMVLSMYNFSAKTTCQAFNLVSEELVVLPGTTEVELVGRMVIKQKEDV